MLTGTILAFLGWKLVHASPDRPFYLMLAMFGLGVVLMAVGGAEFVMGVIDLDAPINHNRATPAQPAE